MPKIGLADSFEDVCVKMCEGNPGALTVCMDIAKYAEEIDPDANPQGTLGIMSILNLDTLGLYGSSIWLLYKDVCGQNLAQMLAVLRGHQLGYLSEQDVQGAAQYPPIATLDVADVVRQVSEALPNFNAGWERTSFP